MIIHAYAKINLGLRILRRREDGYHDLETVFHRVDIADEIEITPSETIVFHSIGTEVPADETNLCLRAARLLQNEHHVTRGAVIGLTKRIPVGAGLGGGSSDAASTLLGLNKFWDLHLAPEELLPLAAQLGSDVPYFLRPGSALATGRGEQLERFVLDIPYCIVAAYPGIHISTAWAYSNIRPIQKKDNVSLKSTLLSSLQRPETMQEVIQNDFEQLAFSHYPAIAAVSRSLQKYGSFFTRLSGSGSAVFGLFENEAAGREAISALKQTCSVFFTPPHFTPPADNDAH
jgi:4-diphosphocytidyl-2-C-methyl-D-erythritol kinase